MPQNISQIQSGAGKKVFESIEPQISAFMGDVFEDICMQYLWRENIAERLPFYFRDAGRWWGTNPQTKSQQEIDIIAFEDTHAIFCECKWTNEKVKQDVLYNLIEKSKMFNYADMNYYIFSKSGYSAECKRNIPDNVKLIEYADMFHLPISGCPLTHQ